jgi:hypothetical protein
MNGLLRSSAWARASRAIFGLLVLVGLALPAIAQGSARDEIAAVARALDGLEARWDAKNESVNRADLDAWTKRVAGTGDLQVIFRFYRLFTAVAQRDGNLLAQMGGRVHVALVRHAIDGALTSTAANANFELGQSFLARDGFRDAGQFALMNALSVANAFVRTGVREPEIIAVQAMSNALLGQSFLQGDRPGAALYYLRLAVAQAGPAGFSDRNKAALGNLLKQAEAGAAAIPAAPPDTKCDEEAQHEERRRNACLSQAEVLWSRSDLAGAEAALARLAGSFTCMNVGEARQEIVQRLMFVRALRERPGQPALRDAVCAVANQIAARRPIAASALAMPTIRAFVDQGRYDSEIADLAAHIARRWIRENQDLFAWYFMEALSQVLDKGQPPANMSPRSASDQMSEQKLARSLLALDRAYLAERSGWAAAGEIERARTVADAEAVDLDQIERLRENLRKYWLPSYGFMTPTPAAAAEFYARAARRLPAGDERRRTALVLWLGLENIHRADEPRAARIAAELIEQARREGLPERITLATLLDVYAGIVRHTKPELADNALREALAIFNATPGHETARLNAMLNLEHYRHTLGDIAGAERFFAEAMALRNSGAQIEESSVALFDMRHAERLMDAEERDQAILLAEDAMRRLVPVAQRKGEDWSVVSPASTLAQLYARAGQLERAREVYSKHILPWANPVVTGDATALNARMALASLEALYGPTADTITRLREILENATRRAAGARELQEAGWRWLAFAYLGVGEHREALVAARRSSSLKPPQGASSEQIQADRGLAETHVAAAWRVVN